MRIQDVLLALAEMEADGVVDRYASGGAVGATFYLEPVATLDVDVFVAFRAEAVTVRLPGGDAVVNDVSFGIDERTFMGVVGPSGSGKSTLLGALARPNGRTVGTVRYGDHDLYGEYAALRSRIGLVPQDDLLHSELTVDETLWSAAELRFPSDVPKAAGDLRPISGRPPPSALNAAQLAVDLAMQRLAQSPWPVDVAAARAELAKAQADLNALQTNAPGATAVQAGRPAVPLAQQRIAGLPPPRP